MENQFETWGIEETNCILGIDLEPNMSFEQITVQLDMANIDIYYFDGSPEGVLDGIKNKQRVFPVDSLDLIHIDILNIYMAF